MLWKAFGWEHHLKVAKLQRFFYGNLRDAKTREAAPPKEGPIVVQTDSDTVIGPGMMLYPRRGDPTSPPSGGRCGNGRHDSYRCLKFF